MWFYINFWSYGHIVRGSPINIFSTTQSKSNKVLRQEASKLYIELTASVKSKSKKKFIT